MVLAEHTLELIKVGDQSTLKFSHTEVLFSEQELISRKNF